MKRQFSDDSIRFLDQGEEKAAICEQVGTDSATLFLSGKLSGEVANTLLDEMTALIVAGLGIFVDMENVTYISPSVMDVFLRMERRLEQKNKYLRVTKVSQALYNQFKARGLHELLDIEVIKQ